MMHARVYIARHERHEAVEAWRDRLSTAQIQHLIDNDADFWLQIDNGKTQLLAIEDEG